MEHSLELDEGDRQIVLLALAALSVERPGWHHALSGIAQRIDNPGPELFEKFRALRIGSHEAAAVVAAVRRHYESHRDSETAPRVAGLAATHALRELLDEVDPGSPDGVRSLGEP